MDKWRSNRIKFIPGHVAKRRRWRIHFLIIFVCENAETRKANQPINRPISVADRTARMRSFVKENATAAMRNHLFMLIYCILQKLGAAGSRRSWVRHAQPTFMPQCMQIFSNYFIMHAYAEWFQPLMGLNATEIAARSKKKKNFFSRPLLKCWRKKSGELANTFTEKNGFICDA